MLRAHLVTDGRASTVEPGADHVTLPAGCTWVDLAWPSREDEQIAERWFGINLPTREEMSEIEASSRLYEQHGAAFMTATLLAHADTARPESAAVTFVLTERALVTIRYADPQAFRTFEQSLARQPAVLASPGLATTAMLDAIVDRLADVLERVQADLETVSRALFDEAASLRATEFPRLLGQIVRAGDLVSRVRESLVSLGRVDGFARRLDVVRSDPAAVGRLKTLHDDILSLTDHATFLSSKLEFLLNTTLGKINIDQNNTIKIFSVVAVVFLPPTLIASIYGMNFEHMPELDWTFGYPAVLAAMVVAAIAPYLAFRRLGWL